MISFAGGAPGSLAGILQFTGVLPQRGSRVMEPSSAQVVSLEARRPRSAPAPARVAVLLNAHARKVTPGVLRALSHVVPRGDLYVSRSPLDARRIAHAVLDGGYHTVFFGGGDGTFMGFADEVLNHAARHRLSTLPHFGVLKLGTGNSLATLVNASPVRGGGIVDDVLRARAGEVPGYRPLELLSAEGRRAPFAGLGVDALLLNDYVWLKERVRGRWLGRLLTGSRGYAASVLLRTLPQALARNLAVECEVRNRGPTPAYRLGPDGQPLRAFEPGEVLYRGPAMVAAAGTIPFYGYGLRVFPFAGQRPGMMHLRVGVIRPLAVLGHLPALWRGEWFPPGVQDFVAAGVDVRTGRPMPFQLGGDALGERSELSLQVAPERVSLVDFSSRPALPA
ncbi:MAG TPA: diacylglycerol kinase family protein [Myxococcaceae bacterium]|nr:diacylglycerol kinase family protein [Myxococcaceae bacterium]